MIKNKKMSSKKAAIEFDTLMYWIIGIVVLFTLLAFYFKLSGRMTDLVGSIKNLFRFGA